MKGIKEFFIENFGAALKSIGVDKPQEEKYIIVPTTEEEKLTSMDERYKLWITPGISRIRLSYESLINSLVKEQKKVMPLWIKMHKEKDKPVVLQISHRYRKMRDVILRYRDLENAPFQIAEDSLFEFSELKERREAIRILFFTQKLSLDLKNIIGDEIKFNEVKWNYKNHFEKYRFYPPSYKHTKEGEDTYSSIVIDKDAKTGTFSIFKNPNMEAKVKSKVGIEKAIKYYLQEELNYKICGLEIKD